MSDRARFRSMDESTAEDWGKIVPEFLQLARGLPRRVLTHLMLLDKDFGGFPVDRLHHSLLTATLAQEGGEDDEYVTCALIHDIGDTLGTWNHADVAAAILKPFISDENLWMIEKHAVFQGYNFFHHIGRDRNMRDALQGHAAYDRTARFVEKYDNPAFDPDKKCLPLEHFAPIVERVLSAPKRSLYQ